MNGARRPRFWRVSIGVKPHEVIRQREHEHTGALKGSRNAATMHEVNLRTAIPQNPLLLFQCLELPIPFINAPAPRLGRI
jgi:hypothetical protein